MLTYMSDDRKIWEYACRKGNEKRFCYRREEFCVNSINERHYDANKRCRNSVSPRSAKKYRECARRKGVAYYDKEEMVISFLLYFKYLSVNGVKIGSGAAYFSRKTVVMLKTAKMVWNIGWLLENSEKILMKNSKKWDIKANLNILLIMLWTLGQL